MVFNLKDIISFCEIKKIFLVNSKMENNEQITILKCFGSFCLVKKLNHGIF